MATSTLNQTISAAAEPDDLILEPLDDSKGPGNVALGEVISIALSSLLSNKVRAILTMLGIIIGVASVVALLAIGTGASSAITSNIASNGTNTLTVMPGAGGGGPGSSTQAEMTMADVDAINKLNLPLDGRAPSYGSSSQIIAASADTNATVTGVTADYRIVNNLTLTSGSFLSAGQVSGASSVVVLGSDLASELFGTGQAVGQTVRIEGKTLRVIGVLASKGGGGFGSVDNRAFVPITLAQKQLFGGRSNDGASWKVNSLQVAVTNSDDIDSVQARIEAYYGRGATPVGTNQGDRT